MKIGYARVSTDEQNLDLQMDALQADGCERIFEDPGVSGSTTSRPGLDETLAALSAGDVLVVWKLDRLGRSLTHLVGLMDELRAQSIGFRSITENIDTETPAGKLTYHVIAALSEFERDLVSQRTIEGMAAARRRGVKVGRPVKFTSAEIRRARLMIEEGQSQRDIAKFFGVGVRTLQRYIKAG